MINISLYEAGINDKGVFDNMMQLYLHDLSAYVDYELGAKGRFQQSKTTIYMGSIGTKTYIIHSEYRIYGFMVVSIEPETLVLRDFFVLRKWRRQSVAKSMIMELLTRKNQLRYTYDSRIESGNSFWRSFEDDEKVNIAFEENGGETTVTVSL